MCRESECATCVVTLLRDRYVQPVPFHAAHKASVLLVDNASNPGLALNAETRTEEARTEGPVECGVAAHDHDVGIAGVRRNAVVQATLMERRESGNVRLCRSGHTCPSGKRPSLSSIG